MQPSMRASMRAELLLFHVSQQEMLTTRVMRTLIWLDNHIAYIATASRKAVQLFLIPEIRFSPIYSLKVIRLK